MPSRPRNIPEQDQSIKARSSELFVDDAPVDLTRATKPFRVYLRETPARPLSIGIKALFWVLGIVVGVLFLIAIWRVAHGHGARPASSASSRPVA